MEGEVASQSELAKKKNVRFLLGNIESYRASMAKLDSYVEIRKQVNEAVAGIDCPLDVGNGGVFDYNTSASAKDCRARPLLQRDP